jgi:putative phosphoribosyl transferase
MFRDRKHAAHLLAEKIGGYKNSDAIVIAIPRGGVPVGYHLAQALQLPLDIVPSRRIKDPAHSNQTIGSVCLNGSDFVESTYDIPQDYIYHQATMIKYSLRCQYKFYRGNEVPICLKDKNVLLVDDKLSCENQILACVRSVRSQQPKKIIVVAPVAAANTLRRLQNENCDVVCLIAPSRTNAVEAFYEYLPPVTDTEVKELLLHHSEMMMPFSTLNQGL